MYHIEIENRCHKELKRLDKQILRKAFDIIENQIALDPYNAKHLTGPYKGMYCYRYGDYRIIYEIIEKRITIIILRIGHRKNVYDGL